MRWLNEIADELEQRYPSGEILIESGSSPSGSYHLGHLRELVTCDAILLELKRRGREARHIQFVDDLDALRKIPANIPTDYEQHLGFPLCDVPSPVEGFDSYGDYFLDGLVQACDILGVEVEYVRAHEKYRSGFYVSAIEKALENIDKARASLESVAGRKLDDHWSPIQVMEDGRLKNRKFVSLDKNAKTLIYEDKDGNQQTISYDNGLVKLDWRLDWPGRWWLQNVAVEPSGRDHMTKGGSYDTGVQIVRDIYDSEPPLPVAYDFINMAGDTKKMSASKGTGLDALEGAQIMPAEVVRYFILRSPPSKRLYFDPVNGLIQLMDEYAAFNANADKSDSEKQLYYICTRGVESNHRVSQVPFSHLVACYQAALKDLDKTMHLIRQTEHGELADSEKEIIRSELEFVDRWLDKRAPDEVKFAIAENLDAVELNDAQKDYLRKLADKLESAPDNADGHWYHAAIYEFKDQVDLAPKELFTTVYNVLLNQDSGPRAGWFLSILPQDWLLSRLRLEK